MMPPRRRLRGKQPVDVRSAQQPQVESSPALVPDETVTGQLSGGSAPNANPGGGEAPESCQQPERSNAVASRKASSSASSSSASSGSDSEPEEKPLDVLRGSSSESDMEPAPASARGRCGLITWSCPRQFPSTIEERRAANLLLPEDMGKEAFGQAILACLRKNGLVGNLQHLVVVQEYHKKFMPAEDRRAVHLHAIVALKMPFAHKKLGAWLLQNYHINVWWSFNLRLGSK